MLDNYDVRFCRVSELNELIDFIRKYWKEDHIFVKRKELLLWQHQNGSDLNFVIGKNKKEDRIDGVYGFISTSHYDKKLIEERDYWGAIWKVNDLAPPGLGLELFNYSENINNVVTLGSIGISRQAKKIYKFLGHELGFLNHYYILSTSVKKYEIASIDSNFSLPVVALGNDSCFSLREILDIRNVNIIHAYKPKKTTEYLFARYQKHPEYKYRFIGIYSADNLLAVFVIRKIDVFDSSCLRIIDVLGNLDNIPNLYNFFQTMMSEEKVEYIDCLNYGISESIFSHIGFSLLTDTCGVIIPNYFEPFLKEKVLVEIAFESKNSEYVVFKGDADQDRPNI